MNENKYGVLLAISSLPGDYGIGDFGRSAYDFVRFLKDNSYCYWQILPLNPVGPGNSPYMSTCSEAIDERYIDLSMFKNTGYLIRMPNKIKQSERADYKKSLDIKEKTLFKIFTSCHKKYPKSYKLFKTMNEWVYPFATYTIFKKVNDGKTWNKWPDEMKLFYDNHQKNEIPKKYKQECEFIIFKQFIAHYQWNNLLKFARESDVKIIADCPFYVGLDSVDCWINKDQFLMDKQNNPTYVGGCPPDAFSDDGQLWGTPIYDFEKMGKDHYRFLVNRIGNLASMCDYLRLDHFRAFDTYCVIPSDDKDAKRGKWEIGPRNKFFDSLYEEFPNINLIAEDLGELFPTVHELRDHYKLPGMYVAQFMITNESNNSNGNQVVYSGTHDNPTTESWVNSLSKDFAQYMIRRFKETNDLVYSFLKYVAELPSFLTIFTMQDLLRLPDYARMNRPGTIGSPNWEWKLKDKSYINNIKFSFKEITKN